MAFQKITENVEIHQTLPDNPALPPDLLKKEWDKGNKIIKQYFNQLIDELNNNLYPIGTGFIAFNNNDYSNYLGFQWEKTLIGRTPVGKDELQTEFNTVGKQGGHKGLQAHVHDLYLWNFNGASSTGVHYGLSYLNNTGSQALAGINENIGNLIGSKGTGDSGNLQPYEVVNFWKRIS